MFYKKSASVFLVSFLINVAFVIGDDLMYLYLNDDLWSILKISLMMVCFVSFIAMIISAVKYGHPCHDLTSPRLRKRIASRRYEY